MRRAAVTFEATTLSYSPRLHLQQRRNIYFFLIRPQFFFFTLHAEHGYAVGEFVAFGADVHTSTVLPVLISASAMRNA